MLRNYKYYIRFINMNRKTICIIPARLASTRFPNKPLAKVLGLSMSRHILRRVKLSNNIDEIYYAVCDKKLYDHIVEDGGNAVMTKNSHETCIDRVEEAVRKILPKLNHYDNIIIVQGDEVQITPTIIDDMVIALNSEQNYMVNLACPITEEYYEDANSVKIVADLDDYAMYLSRSPLPSTKRHIPKKMLRQTGLMGFRVEFLYKFSKLENGPLEKSESIDVLRILEHGYKIKLIYTDFNLQGIDSENDLKCVEERFKNDPLLKEYM